MNIETTWDWKTHQPLIRLMMIEYHPELVVELGMGHNSTPLFLQYNLKKYIGVENDKEWIEEIKKQYIFKSEYSVIFHDLGGEITSNTRLYGMPDKKKVENFEYYVQLRNQISKIELKPKLLFVDNFACLRALAINTLGSVFDIILYHDCEPRGVFWYGYRFNEDFKNYNQFFLSSTWSWTGCFLKKSLRYNMGELSSHIQPYINAFRMENKVKGEMRLQENY